MGLERNVQRFEFEDGTERFVSHDDPKAMMDALLRFTDELYMREGDVSREIAQDIVTKVEEENDQGRFAKVARRMTQGRVLELLYDAHLNVPSAHAGVLSLLMRTWGELDWDHAYDAPIGRLVFKLTVMKVDEETKK